MSAPFTARYAGPCAGCEERIFGGDEVWFVDDQLVHVGCMPAPEREPDPRPVCPTCFMEIALNGACSC